VSNLFSYLYKAKSCQFSWSLVFTCAILIAAVLVLFDFESDKDHDEMDLAKAALGMVMRWPSKEKIALGSLWTDQTCVVFFMRRFG